MAGTGYPIASTPSAPPAAAAQALSPADQAQLDLLYEELKPEATMQARNYVLNRTPAAWQADMATKIDADWPVPAPPA
jgi:hypothetical protein